MKRIFFMLAFLVAFSVSSAQNANLQVAEAPDYLSFDSKSSLKLSDLKNLLLAINGFPVEKNVEWDGLKKTKSIEFPRATLLFVLNNNLTQNDQTESISVIQDTDLNFDYLKKLSLSSDTAVKFLDNVPSSNDIEGLDCSTFSSFYVFELSESVNENKIKEINKKASEKCSNNVVSLILVSDKPLRNKRQVNLVTKIFKIKLIQKASGESSNLKAKIINEAVFYSDNYPAMFNLIFWSSLILGLAVFGITYGMWNMDPGLDTVIYRMTSQRIKKDQ